MRSRRTVITLIPVVVLAASCVHFTAPRSGLAAPGTSLVADTLAMGDITGDGLADPVVLAISPADPGLTQIVWMTPCGDSCLEPAGSVAAPSSTDLAIGDLDDDGIDDVVVVDDEGATAYFGSGADGARLAGLDAADTASITGPSTEVGVDLGWDTVWIADLNDDGIDDPVFGVDSNVIATVPSNGDGTFGARDPLYVSLTPQVAIASVVTPDLDGDGSTDLAITRFGLSGNDMLFFGAPGFAYDPPAGRWSTTLAGDIDGDGRDDLGLSSTSLVDGSFVSNPPVLLRSTGSTLTPFVGADEEKIAPVITGLMDDLDGDGRADLVGPNDHEGSTLEWWTGLGSGDFAGFGEPDSTHTSADPVAQIAVGDVDGDGVLDLAAIHEGVAGAKVTLLIGASELADWQ